MKNEAKDKTAERLAIAIVLVFLLGFGWLTLLQGGITLKGKSGHESFVDGRLGIATAGFDFLIAALCALLLGKSFNAHSRTYAILLVGVLVPPVIFLLLP